MTDIERHCARCGVLVEECMGFILARDQTAFITGARIVQRELCGKCILIWSSRYVEGQIIDRTQEERVAFIDALPPPRPLLEMSDE